MAEFIHSVLAQDEAVVAGGVYSWDLPVNPLSHILFTFKFQQNKPDTSIGFWDILGNVTKVEVLYKGSAIFSMNGWDCFAQSLFVCGFESWGLNWNGDDDDELSLTYLIPLGRIPFKAIECFPRSTRGELVLQITFPAAFTRVDNTRVQIETVELPDASPGRYLRMTTLSVTPTAVGELDIELPIGNPISDLICYGLTKPDADDDTVTLEYAQILVDNQRRFYSHINYETWHNMAGMNHPPPGYWGFHQHQTDGAGYVQFANTSYNRPGDHVYGWWNHLTFDIFKDLEYALQTAGKSDIVLRVYAGDINAIRVIPCEIVGV